MATASVDSFRGLAQELGTEWYEAHTAMCAGAKPKLFNQGAMLFKGLHNLQHTYLILHGEATVLATSPEAVANEGQDPQTAEALVLQPGDLFSKGTLTWLEPLTLTAVARCDMQLLELPQLSKVKLALLRTLHARVTQLRTLPLLEKCSDTALRALAYAARSEEHASGSAILQQGEACDGLTVLTSGRASISVAGGPATPGIAAGEKIFMGVVTAPELLGVIDLMKAVVAFGRASDRAGFTPHRNGVEPCRARTPPTRSTRSAFAPHGRTPCAGLHPPPPPRHALC